MGSHLKQEMSKKPSLFYFEADLRIPSDKINITALLIEFMFLTNNKSCICCWKLLNSPNSEKIGTTNDIGLTIKKEAEISARGLPTSNL